MNQPTNFWALCDKLGAIYTDENGQSLIFESRELARTYLTAYRSEMLHVEKVEIR